MFGFLGEVPGGLESEADCFFFFLREEVSGETGESFRLERELRAAIERAEEGFLIKSSEGWQLLVRELERGKPVSFVDIGGG